MPETVTPQSATPPGVTLVAADDHQIFLEGVASLLRDHPHLELAATANNGDDLLSLLGEHSPDVVLLDLSMPGADTETILAAVESDYPDMSVIALTMFSDGRIARKYLDLGMAGYVVKDDAFDDLVTAIDEVVAGGQFISASLVGGLTARGDAAAEPVLTPQEQAVLRAAAEGKSNKEIARLLDISERTVRFHMSNCFSKFGVGSRGGAIAVALTKNLI